ncbi:MAG: DUF1460 domain-containing protein [Bacteroidales bacterium]|nr:DUF1460 domain-containing protein [Bacteroidales bacterium]
MRKWFLLLVSLLPFLICYGHSWTYVTTDQDRALAEKVLKKLEAHQDEEPGNLMVRAANALLGQPYVAGTLEESPNEKLCVYLTRTDCILFVETCLGLVQTARRNNASFDSFVSELQQSRYRDGDCSRYEDRLHYTTEWARQGVARGVLEDMTEALGGVRYDHPVHYMSMHPDAYPRMTDVDAIKAVEDSINAIPSTYIPKSALKSALGGIRNGDIILFTTTVDGLDVSHCAIAKVDAGKPVRFIHASTGAMKVILEPRTLEEYVTGRKAVTGIQVFRVR